MKENAIILTGGVLNMGNAKTAHGLIRATSRYNIIGVIDETSAKEDAGFVVDKIVRGIPVYASFDAFMNTSEVKPAYAIIGVAFPGGRLPDDIAEEIKLVLKAGISIVSGLHDYLSDMPELKSLAEEYNAKLIDIRKPHEKKDLKFWSGNILQVRSPIIGVIGTDCALGKRTTAVMITRAMNDTGVNAHLVFTGQTGWMQGYKYGFILDSTYNDFISGELENAIVSCNREEAPDIIFVEGQSALCNPSGPCGAEYLLSGQCKGVILQHSPKRIYYHGQEKTGIKISLRRELGIIRLYGSAVIAITLNTEGLNYEEAKLYQKQYEEEYNIPVVLPMEEGVDKLVQAVKEYTLQFNNIDTLQVYQP